LVILRIIISDFAVFAVLRTAYVTPVAIAAMAAVVALLKREGGFKGIAISSAPISI
jgi:hypothetical protein